MGASAIDDAVFLVWYATAAVAWVACTVAFVLERRRSA